MNPEIFIEDIPLEDFEQALQKDGAKTLIALRKKERRNRDLNPNLAVVIEKFEERYDENLGIEEIWKREREDWKRNKKRRKK